MPRATWLQNLIVSLLFAKTRLRPRRCAVPFRAAATVIEVIEVRRMLSGSPVSVTAGAETQVNTHTNGDQVRPQVAMDSKGDYVVVWTDYSGLDRSGQGIFAQRYSASGAPVGSNFRVNTYTTGNQFQPSVAMDAGGDFVVTWTSYRQDGQGWGIFAHRYSAGGIAEGHEFRVNVTTTRDQINSSVAMDSTGNFVISWTSIANTVSTTGIFARTYQAGGAPAGPEFKVNSYTTGAQDHSAVGMDAKGNFVVAWDASSGDGSGYGIFARRFNASGTPLGLDFTVNTFTKNNQFAPAVARDAAGDFVITWESDLKDGSGFGIAARRYNAAGVAQGAEFNVNTYTKGTQFHPVVAMDAVGNFAIAWDSFEQDGSLDGIYLRRFTASGGGLGTEVKVNTYTTSVQAAPSIAMDAAGDFVVTWDSYGQDGHSYGVFMKRYKVA